MSWQCSTCGRYFRSQAATEDHIRGKHKKKGGSARPPAPEERSIADQLLEAMEAHAMGETPDPVMVSMFPDSFPTTEKDDA